MATWRWNLPWSVPQPWCLQFLSLERFSAAWPIFVRLFPLDRFTTEKLQNRTEWNRRNRSTIYITCKGNGINSALEFVKFSLILILTFYRLHKMYDKWLSVFHHHGQLSALLHVCTNVNLKDFVIFETKLVPIWTKTNSELSFWNFSKLWSSETVIFFELKLLLQANKFTKNQVEVFCVILCINLIIWFRYSRFLMFTINWPIYTK